MLAVTVTVSVDGIPEAQRMVAGYQDREMHNRLRRAVRAGAKPMQAALKVAAATEPSGNVPASFRKVMAAKVSASQRRGGDIVASVRPKSPLYNIFEPGAGAHEIGGGSRTTGALAGPAGGPGWDPGGRKRPGTFFARGRVRHPGFRARPIRPAAFRAGRPAAQLAIARVLFEDGA